MGQYYKIQNMDKQEYIDPHVFGDGAKLLEFGCSGMGTMLALSILLADGNGRGGGDLMIPESANKEVKAIVGSWAGDRIVVSGDYADKGRFTTDADMNLYQLCTEDEFKDISSLVIEAMCYDRWVREGLLEKVQWRDDKRIPECLQKVRAEASESNGRHGQ